MNQIYLVDFVLEQINLPKIFIHGNHVTDFPDECQLVKWD